MLSQPYKTLQVSEFLLSWIYIGNYILSKTAEYRQSAMHDLKEISKIRT